MTIAGMVEERERQRENEMGGVGSLCMSVAAVTDATWYNPLIHYLVTV